LTLLLHISITMEIRAYAILLFFLKTSFCKNGFSGSDKYWLCFYIFS